MWQDWFYYMTSSFVACNQVLVVPGCHCCYSRGWLSKTLLPWCHHLSSATMMMMMTLMMVMVSSPAF